jgi:hypothetical protein
MKFIEFMSNDFFYVRIKSKVLADLLQDEFQFLRYEDDIILDWCVKGDCFIGEEEIQVNYGSNLYPTNCTFDYSKYLINLFTIHKETGLSDEYCWREAFRYYDHEENVNYSDDPLYEEKLESEDLQRIIDKINKNYDAINASVQEACIIEYHFDSDYESYLNVLKYNGETYSAEEYDESDINEAVSSDYFAQDFLVDEFDLEHISAAFDADYYYSEG